MGKDLLAMGRSWDRAGLYDIEHSSSPTMIHYLGSEYESPGLNACNYEPPMRSEQPEKSPSWK